jgi:hypothetical protein
MRGEEGGEKRTAKAEGVSRVRKFEIWNGQSAPFIKFRCICLEEAAKYSVSYPTVF